MSTRGAWLALATLGVLSLIDAPELGSQGWSFRPGAVHPQGPLGPVARAAHQRWDLGVVRSPVVLGGLAVGVVAVALLSGRRIRLWVAITLAVGVAAATIFPAVILQAGLRDATAPWFFVNDSTYQIELAGGLLRDGESPYGHDYAGSGLARFYSLDGSLPAHVSEHHAALRHFPYFPGTAILAASWGAMPHPFDDYRFLVALATLSLLGAALLFPGPASTRLALGALLAMNPLGVRAAWFGTADAPSLLLIVLAFGLAARSRRTEAAATLACAIAVKQFALVAVPFLAVMILRRSGWRGPVLAFSGVLAALVLPFVVLDPHAFWTDTIAYGGSQYRIIGYGLAALLLRAHLIKSRTGSYPFFPLALLVWAPATLWLVRVQRRASESWLAGVCFALSIFLLLFLARVFQTSYLVYPLVGLAVAGLLAARTYDDETHARSAAH